MLGDPRRIAPVLIASLVAMIIAVGAVARAEPAAAKSAAADCLTKPGGQTAPGNHWYYRVDRGSGRHCWYQHAEMGASNETGQSRRPVRATAAAVNSPPPARSVEARSVDKPIEADDQDAA